MSTPLRVIVPVKLVEKLVAVAHRKGKTADALVNEWIEEKLANEPVVHQTETLLASPAGTCRHPGCKEEPYSREVCRRIYMRILYFKKRKMLNESWLVRHGKIAPPRGVPLEAYEVEKETLATLPSDPPDEMPETRWLFGWPDAQRERRRLLVEADNAASSPVAHPQETPQIPPDMAGRGLLKYLKKGTPS